MDSPFKKKLAETNMRLIDWNRGEPYTFRISDISELINSDILFARKFDEKIDFEIVKKNIRQFITMNGVKILIYYLF